ncbi:MAG: hypothetical protein ACI9U5_000812 [Colwellia sp.]|jgi:hypothetical protein
MPIWVPSLLCLSIIKLLDSETQIICATGIKLKTRYINNILKVFQQRYQLSIYFIDITSKVVIAE